MLGGEGWYGDSKGVYSIDLYHSIINLHVHYLSYITYYLSVHIEQLGGMINLEGQPAGGQVLVLGGALLFSTHAR